MNEQPTTPESGEFEIRFRDELGNYFTLKECTFKKEPMIAVSINHGVEVLLNREQGVHLRYILKAFTLNGKLI